MPLESLPVNTGTCWKTVPGAAICCSWIEKEPVEILPVLLTVTTPALLPAPPKPPTEADICFASGPAIAPATLKPPLPPPPPIDCARTPTELSPTVVVMPERVTVTSLPAPPAPPKPPTDPVIDPFFSLEKSNDPAALKPPLPPPPPTDCAITPAEFARCVSIFPVTVAVTVPASPPPPPNPPRLA